MRDVQELSPVRLTGGGEMLLLADTGGSEYVVPLDVRLRDTLGQSFARPAINSGVPAPRTSSASSTPGTRQKEPTMVEAMRPREIQDRVRAGESAEDLAAAAGTPVDKVMIWAAPVLAERAHVAHLALDASVRRGSEGAAGSARDLGESALARLREEGSDPETLTWDAWRREDGRWTLQASYRSDGAARAARFVFDQRGRFVTAADDEGRWLVGEVPLSRTPAAPVVPDAPAVPAEAPRLRLAPQPASLPETGAAISAPGEPVDRVEVETHDPDDDAEAAPPAQDQLDALFDVPAATDEARDHDDDAADREDTTGLARRHPRKQRGRASVPTWDEIMFGGRD